MTPPAWQRAALAAVLLPLAACVTAARGNLEPLVTDRPDFTESSETIARGSAQFESGTTFSREGDVKSGSIGEGLLRVGFAPRAELRVGLNSYSISRELGTTVRGLEDASLGAKFKLLQGGDVGSAKPTVAVIVASSLPTGAAPFRSKKLQPEAKLIGSWDFTDRFSFASNVNYSWVREEFDSFGEVAATGSFGIGITEKVGSYVEYYGFYPRFDGAEKSHFANGGLTFGLSNDLQLDARVGKQVGRRDIGRNYFVGVGIARRW